jgi:apolipoprotein N-acyltransferase
MPELSALRARPGSRMETPLCRLAQDLASLSGWRRYGVGFLLGVLLAAAFPPVDLTPLIFVAFPGLLWLDDGSRTPWASARLAYVFALGFFVAGLYWIAAALFVDIASFWWALPFAVLGLPAFLSLYPAAAMLLTALASRRFKLPATARVCLFAIAWSAAEWLRGHLLTGMPWNLTGYVWSGGFPGSLTVLQSVAAIGIYGLGFVTVLAASFVVLLGVPSLSPISAARRWTPAFISAALILIPAIGGAIRLDLSPTKETGIWLRLVQPSISQSLKWDGGAAEENFRRLIELSAAKAAHPLAAILWPEAATTSLLDRDPVHRKAIGAVAPKGGYVLTGALRANPPPGTVVQVWNSIEAIDATSEIRASYDKAHLVPFGEYMPLRDVLPLKKITPGTIDLSAGPGPTTIALPGLPAVSPLICYEAIFPDAIVDRSARPDWLLNVTNDAWYGRSSGPYQHFAIARTRAVEEGLPLVRVANNGISGVIDPEGRVLARTNLDDVTYADVALPAPGAKTPYALIGDWSFLALLIVGLVPVAMRLR